MTILNLHAEALADLPRSGLSDPTIVEAGLYTPAPGDLPRLSSPRLVDQVRHVMVIPYDGVGHGGLWRRGDEFARCKLFPPVNDGEGHAIRYYQRAVGAPAVRPGVRPGGAPLAAAGFTPETLPAGLALRHTDPGASSVRHETVAAWGKRWGQWRALAPAANR
jgi:hypothetical protein